jgi:CBS domain-containing protein
MTVRRLLENKGRFVPIIRSDLKLSDVIDQLALDEAGALIVTDDGATVLGIITERDIARGLKKHGRDVMDKPLRELMTKEVISVDINEPLVAVLQLMHDHQIHYVPVKDRGSLCGIINMLDLVKHRLDESQLEANALRSYICGSA